MILIHPSLNRLGGAERVCIRMIEALRSVGHDVTLYTIERTLWERIETNWGTISKPREVWCLKDQRYTHLSFLRWPLFLLLYLRLLIKAAKKRGYISLNNYGEVLPIFSDISYIHSIPLSSSEGNPLAIPFWFTIKPLYVALLRTLSSFSSPLLLTNSLYNKRKISHYTLSHLIVLYPPVDCMERISTPKTNSILTASRYSASKRLEIIPTIAKHVTSVCVFNICLIGGDNADIRLLRGPSINIVRNPPAKRLNHLRQSSMIYLSTQPTEALGLSILEAMTAGCIPVVPKDGGPWVDILDKKQGEVGFAYENPVEAAEQIDAILRNPPLAEKIAKSAEKFTARYPSHSFDVKLIRTIEALHDIKTGNV